MMEERGNPSAFAGERGEGPVTRAHQLAPRYDLRLYVAGMTGRSLQAIANIRAVCEAHLEGRYDLRVVDVYQVRGVDRDQVVALPTLVKRTPEPLRRLVGDMSDHARVLAGLDLRT